MPACAPRRDVGTTRESQPGVHSRGPVHGGATRNAYAFQEIVVCKKANVQSISLKSGTRSFSFVARYAEGAEALRFLRNAADGTYGGSSDDDKGEDDVAAFASSFEKYIRVISFDSPLTVCNLLASPVQYRLRGIGPSKIATTDGYLPSGPRCAGTAREAPSLSRYPFASLAFVV